MQSVAGLHDLQMSLHVDLVHRVTKNLAYIGSSTVNAGDLVRLIW